MSQEMVDLTTAAQRLGFSSERCRRAVLTQRLVGERRNGFWFVTTDSLTRYVREMAEKNEDLTATTQTTAYPCRRSHSIKSPKGVQKRPADR